jgi:glycosyltransferase involved in cell wall biosynthesis
MPEKRQQNRVNGKKLNLSVILIARDAEDIIDESLKSVKWADEIIVVIDDRTIDKTAAIAKKYTSKVYLKKFKGFGAQCQYALSKATSKWVLKLDTDERISFKLKNEIIRKISSNRFAGYHAYFQPVFLGKKLKSNSKTQGTVRLFLRNKSKFEALPVHERVIVDGEIGLLKNEILHDTNRTIFQTLEKYNQFSSLEAEQLYRVGGRTSLFYILAAPVVAFFRVFVRWQNYRNGMHGFIYSLLYFHYYLIKHLKLWELGKGGKE